MDLNLDLNKLTPKVHALSNGNVVYGYPSETIDLVKLDFSFEAGSMYQPKLLCAAAASQLIGEGTKKHSALDIAEFMDFRGIVFDKSPDYATSVVTFYTLRKYFDELLPWIDEIINEPEFLQSEFEVWKNKRQQQLMANMQNTAYVARNIFCEALYGKNHPMGVYAVPEDFDKLTLDDVKKFYKEHYCMEHANLEISGNYDEQMLKTYDKYFGSKGEGGVKLGDMSRLRADYHGGQRLKQAIEGSVQSTLRIGRLLPMRWDSLEYAQFLVLTTVLGGYMGSRLMSNVREDKGYTYGIYAQTKLQRESIEFVIRTDVGGEYTQAALNEIYKELQRLIDEPIPEEELNMVREVMRGDFLRSIDGIFERSERFRQMTDSCITEKFTENYFEAVKHVTAKELQELAAKVLRKDELTEVIVGVV